MRTDPDHLPALQQRELERVTQTLLAEFDAAVAGGTQPFTMDSVPVAGEFPAGWGGRTTPAGTFIFEGPKGTESYEVSIELGLEPKASGVSIDGLAREIVGILSKKPKADIQAPAGETANDGTPVRIVRGTYGLAGQGGGLVLVRHLTVVLDYPGYYAILSYFTPDAIYQKYSEVFTLFVQRFHHTGK